MRDLAILFIRLIVIFVRLLGPGGLRAIDEAGRRPMTVKSRVLADRCAHAVDVQTQQRITLDALSLWPRLRGVRHAATL